MDKSIINFISHQKCASICCIDINNYPYCFSCYYAFNEEEEFLYFKSSSETEHIKHLQNNPIIAGTILPDKLQTFKVQGIQFTGKLLFDIEEKIQGSSTKYHKRFPYALVISGIVWTVEIHSIKMTDSTKGFGHKIIWERSEIIKK